MSAERSDRTQRRAERGGTGVEIGDIDPINGGAIGALDVLRSERCRAS
jgi:hypothetical protein